MASRNALLWEIHSKNIFKGYIFGTMHVPIDVAFSDFGRLKVAIDECEIFAPEIPLHSDAQQKMGGHVNLPNDLKLSNLLSARKYEKYNAILRKSFGLNLELFDKMLPLFLLNYMTQQALSTKADNPVNSMDFQLWSYAESMERELSSMESIDDHIQTLNQISLDYQLRSLRSALSNVSKFRSKTLQLLDLYQNQEIHKLYKLSKKSIGSIKDVLLYSRNHKMAANFAQLSTTKSVFAAVGAAHLSGKTGLLHLLRKEGYSLSPVKLDLLS